MQYLGGKSRIAKHLLPVILADRQEDEWLEEQWYVEPFVGGANVIDKVEGRRIGNDNNNYLISLWKALQEGWRPPSTVSREEYSNIRSNTDKYPPELVAFVAYLCSYGGKWWGGYAFNSNNDNYAQMGINVLTKQINRLKDVKFVCGDYWDMEIPDNSLIYCDPPYEGTEKYRKHLCLKHLEGKFDHKKFWQWCRDKSKEGHTVFISEYNAPEDFEELIAINHKLLLNKKTNLNRVEKLFKFCGE